MSSTSVAAETGPGWAILRMSAPSGLNMLGGDSLRAVTAAVEEHLADPVPAVLVLAGSGGSFAVGADLAEIGRLTPAGAREFSLLGARLFSALETTRAAVVAAIDGWCLGGGLDLALACDWRIATRRSSFAHPGPHIGILTGWGGTQRLPRLVGEARARETLLAGRRYGAEEACSMGLVQEMAEDGVLEDVLRARIGAFSDLPREALTFLKRRS
jgi:enoyl-CoA hydratase